VTENAGPPDGFPADLGRYYRRCPQALLPGAPQAVFQPVAGPPGRPAYLWLPPGASCAAAVSVLNDATAGARPASIGIPAGREIKSDGR
jgi:hypothetical protein